MLEAFQNLVRSLIGPITPRIDGLDCDCGGSDCGGSDCGGSDCSDCNGSDSGDSCKAADTSSSVESSSEVTESSDCSGSSSDRRTRDAGLVGGAVVGAAAAHHHRKKKEQRNANDASDQDLAAIPRCQRDECSKRGKCDCGGEPYGKRPVRIRLRKQ